MRWQRTTCGSCIVHIHSLSEEENRKTMDKCEKLMILEKLKTVKSELFVSAGEKCCSNRFSINYFDVKDRRDPLSIHFASVA